MQVTVAGVRVSPRQARLCIAAARNTRAAGRPHTATRQRSGDGD